MRSIRSIERSGTWFDPELVRIALSLHRRGALWANCSANDAEEDTRQAVLDLDSGSRHQLEPSQIDQICEAFADVVDAKSHFTFRHSQGVADAAFGIATGDGTLQQIACRLVRRAALLHDIGKLGVSNTILDKRSQSDSRGVEVGLRASPHHAAHPGAGRPLPRDGCDRRRASREAGRLGLS